MAKHSIYIDGEKRGEYVSKSEAKKAVNRWSKRLDIPKSKFKIKKVKKVKQ